MGYGYRRDAASVLALLRIASVQPLSGLERFSTRLSWQAKLYGIVYRIRRVVVIVLVVVFVGKRCHEIENLPDTCMVILGSDEQPSPRTKVEV